MERRLELEDRDGRALVAVLFLPGEKIDAPGLFGFGDETVIQLYGGTGKLHMTCALKTLQGVSADLSVNGPVLERAEVSRVVRWVYAEKARAESYKTFKARPFASSRPSGLAERLLPA